MTRRVGEGVTVRRLSHEADFGTDLASDVLRGLTKTRKELSSKYFYDARGSVLFEEITELPEYYLTRAETEILTEYADDMLAAVEPVELVEIGSGYSVKTRLLINAMERVGSGTRYVPFDISESALLDAADSLQQEFAWLDVESLVGDLHTDLPMIPRCGRRLVTFLGSTIGNFLAPGRVRFYRSVAAMLEPDDGLLVGLDLIKDISTLVAAYDDSAGVTAEFNKNILHVLNRELGANFDVPAFDFIARWDEECECVSMSLRATRIMDVRIEALGITVHLDKDEEIHDEVSCKFTFAKLTTEAHQAGLHVANWWTDSEDRFAVALLRLPNHE